ncbi:MAG TPA: DUF2294 domain-containing protein [Solirubrobacteraceae bacterium]|nr:DUF2294 domain-containing protein [Solirubrobacteraceae bacterium]
MPNPKAARTTDGQLATAIASMVVQVLRQYTGRGPTRSRTYLNDELISVVLQGTLTRAERALVADGNSDLVLSNRRAFQGIMRADLIAGIEELTGRTVIAFLSDNSIDPDVKVKSFVLAPPEELADTVS